MTLDELDEAWQVLNHREKVVLKQRFGLNGDEPRTRKQIGAELGVSPQHIRNIEGQAFFKLRRADRQVQQREGLLPITTITPKPPASPKLAPKPKPVKRRRRKPRYVPPPLLRHSDAERIEWMEDKIKDQSLYIQWKHIGVWTLKLSNSKYITENSLRDLLDRAMMQ